MLASQELQPAEERATQRTVTVQEAGREHVVTEALLGGSPRGTPTQPSQDAQFWHTSVGRFRFTIDQLPPRLQFIYALLMVSS